jgi:hypothetical protein
MLLILARIPPQQAERDQIMSSALMFASLWRDGFNCVLTSKTSIEISQFPEGGHPCD